MDINTVMHYVSRAGVFLTALFSAFISYHAAMRALGKGKAKSKQILHNFDLKQMKTGTYSQKQLFLSKYGIMYRMGSYHLLPSQYATVRVACGLFATLVFLSGTKSVFSVAAFPVGYLAIEMFFKALNKKDNENMTMDIYNTYANMKIQLSSGVYIGECLEYTYRIAKNERYREAMKELLLNFSDKTITSSEAIRIFKNRFACEEIDKLCSMMTSFVEHGISESYMQDIMYEVESLLEADAMKTQHAIESKTGAITFAFFVLVVVMVVVSMIGSFDGVDMFLTGV